MADADRQLIQRRKLYQEVMDRLLEIIRTEHPNVGDHLPSERELMDRFGVGRPAIREALQNLAWMGLVNISHGERARVARPDFRTLIERISLPTSQMLQGSHRSLEELKEARLLFEVQMVRLAAERAGPDDIAQLRERLHAQEAAVSDSAAFVRCDMLFHREIASITGNTIFPALSEAMMGWLGEFYIDLLRVPGAEHLTLSEHRAILDAIAANAPGAAEKAMADHITRANELYRQAGGHAELLAGGRP